MGKKQSNPWPMFPKPAPPSGPPIPKTGVTVKIYGKDISIFKLIGITSKALKGAGFRTEAEEMTERILRCGSYNETLRIIQEYVSARWVF